jgi:adenylate cyclase
VLRGRDFFSHATPDANDEASELFQRAIDLDPNYADAYAALGGSHYEAVISGWSQFREEELEQAEALAKKALALDPTATRAYRVLADIDLFRKRYELALGQLDRALEINPSDADNYAHRGSILVWAGRAEEGLPWLEGPSVLTAPMALPPQGSVWRTISCTGTARPSTPATARLPATRVSIRR